MIGHFAYYNVVQGKDIINDARNPRMNLYADQIKRGEIRDKDGNILAQTKENEDGTQTREYPYGDLYAHVIGYAEKGKSGLESTENFTLLHSSASFLDRIVNEFRDQRNPGDNVFTTLDTNLQQAAYNALGNNKGAVVAIEPDTGKILAMVSKPTFDPNTIVADWETLNQNTEGVLVNRATQGQYAPGSTFKVVTALAFMRQNPDYENYSYRCRGEITAGKNEIHCFGGEVHGTVDLADSLAYSCNTSFSNIGLQLDIDEFKETADGLLFDSELPCPLIYNESKFNLKKGDGDAAIAMTAFGQGKLQVSPYHMALITSAIANGGTLMQPYLVDHVESADGKTTEKYVPEVYEELMTQEEAAKLTEYMQGVVEYGTATTLNGQNFTVAGKTGTSEYSVDKEKTHSWFIGFSNVENPDVALAVIIENSDRTGDVATETAKSVFRAYYNN
ncbi:peptidoglycan glycosyltransferase [Drancourtella sp. An177]|nr:peptidoglycan glycosyltransferase [Drancourtella sp. An177]